jgi:hypothetical protein
MPIYKVLLKLCQSFENLPNYAKDIKFCWVMLKLSNFVELCQSYEILLKLCQCYQVLLSYASQSY